MFRKRKTQPAAAAAAAAAPVAPLTPAQALKAYERTLARAFRLLAAKPRSIAQLRERLREKSADETVTKVIERLRELGYLDDAQFAASFAHSRLTIRPVGRTRLRQDLQRKQLDRQTVEQAVTTAFEEHDEATLVARLLEKRVRVKGVPTTREASKKLVDYLLRRGFSYDVVFAQVRALNRAAVEAEDAESADE